MAFGILCIGSILTRAYLATELQRLGDQWQQEMTVIVLAAPKVSPTLTDSERSAVLAGVKGGGYYIPMFQRIHSFRSISAWVAAIC